MTTSDYDFDYIIVGSGFGGSVSAMRLSQKGYKVGVIESGKRYTAENFPKTNWNIRKSIWLPQLSCYGLWRINIFKDILFLGGAGVGGGSLNYANTMYVPPDEFFQNQFVKQIDNKDKLLPFYELAKKMLGVTQNPVDTEADKRMRETAEDMGCENTFIYTPVAVYFGKEKEPAKDPYFMGEGPDRIGCDLCGGCMVGCKGDAKNSLDKNYLYFAEKFGAEVIPERKVINVTPISEDGSEGYEVKTVRTSRYIKPKPITYRTKSIVFSAGVLGNLSLLLKMKEKKVLPQLSENLGMMVRTNSEALIAVKAKKNDIDYSHGVAITSSVYPDNVTHIEPVRFSNGSDFIGLLVTVLTDGGGRIPRQLRFLFNIFLHPIQFIRWLNPIGFARKSIYLLVMQTLDNSISISRKRHLWWPFQKVLNSTQDIERNVPTYIPLANEFARKLGKRMNGIPGSNINEVILDTTTTAHILGGCIIGKIPEEGVIDLHNNVFGYKNMLVCDGSMIPANLGVNPSLSIVALTERAMSFIPTKDSAEFRHLKVDNKWGVTELVAP